MVWYMKKKSLGKNIVLNILNTVLSTLFPLISFQYTAHILLVENIGKYNFSSSIINYVSLIAGMGIGTFAVREGSRLKDNEKELNLFCSEILQLNLITTLAAYLLFLFALLKSSKLQEYTYLLAILSVTVIFKTLSVEWIFTIFEEFKYITIRNILTKILALIAIIILVKDRNDIYIYTWINTLAFVIPYTVNFIHSKKYIKYSYSRTWGMQYLKPVLVFFASIAAMTIYVSSDVTILGIYCNDYQVGLYSVSTKVYTCVKSVFLAVAMVFIPRVSYCWNNGEKRKYKELIITLTNVLILVIPILVTGLICLADPIIVFLASESYIEAVPSMIILSITLVFSIFAHIWAYCVMIPIGRENIVMYTSFISAFMNIVLNMIFIPMGGANAAAITTLLSELLAMIIYFIISRKKMRLINIKNILIYIIQAICGCIITVFICRVTLNFIDNIYKAMMISSVITASIYIIFLIIIKNKYIMWVLDFIYKKVHR